MGNGALSWRSSPHCPHHRSVLRFENEDLTRCSSPALLTCGDVYAGQTQHHLLRCFRLTRFGDRLAKQRSAQVELANPAAIGEQSVMAQPGKAARKHMQQEAADELIGV